MSSARDLIEMVETLQSILFQCLRRYPDAEDQEFYNQLRSELLRDATAGPAMPRFVSQCGDLLQFKEFVGDEFSYDPERRAFLWEEFAPVKEKLRAPKAPAEEGVSDALGKLDSEAIRSAWSKALERRANDPEGAITAARTLLESVCKHVLDDGGVTYDDASDLPKLYRLAAERLNIAPSQHSEEVFRRILGGCTSVVEGLGSLRNRLSDSHGRGRRPVRPRPRHAELAVDLAGSMAKFLAQTWAARSEK